MAPPLKVIEGAIFERDMEIGNDHYANLGMHANFQNILCVHACTVAFSVHALSKMRKNGFWKKISAIPSNFKLLTSSFLQTSYFGLNYMIMQ